MNEFFLLLFFLFFWGVLFYIFNFNPFLKKFLGVEKFFLIFLLKFLKNLKKFIKQKILFLVFFIFGISESVLGLTILILMVWNYGKGFLKSLKIFPS
uniref:NADH dehydrogenase subunit 4L n=1 Tax=Kurisakia onigurumii TaxID=384362 RepID=A0A1L1YMD5_9HEMI|nr:NADH dehydrogenase subunit 4L [Kurisakia onigurumii]